MFDDALPSARILRQVRGSEQIAAALRGVEFPITKAELVRRLGEVSIEFDRDAVPLAEIVRGVASARFQDAEKTRRAVDARWARIARNLAAVDEGARAVARKKE